MWVLSHDFRFGDCLEVITYLCSKIGIDVIETKTQDKWLGMVLDYKLAPRLSLESLMRDSMYLDTSAFQWNYSQIQTTLVGMCKSIYEFQVVGLDARIVNPFYGADSILEATCKEEAIIAADMFFPDNYSKRVLDFCKKLKSASCQ